MPVNQAVAVIRLDRRPHALVTCNLQAPVNEPCHDCVCVKKPCATPISNLAMPVPVSRSLGNPCLKACCACARVKSCRACACVKKLCRACAFVKPWA
eukprot:1159835-Pelagomonas_calceolata.AAC.3